MQIKLKTLTCLRCGYKWVPRKTDIRRCAKCKTPYWDRPKAEPKRRR